MFENPFSQNSQRKPQSMHNTTLEYFSPFLFHSLKTHHRPNYFHFSLSFSLHVVLLVFNFFPKTLKTRSKTFGRLPPLMGMHATNVNEFVGYHIHRLFHPLSCMRGCHICMHVYTITVACDHNMSWSSACLCFWPPFILPPLLDDFDLFLPFYCFCGTYYYICVAHIDNFQAIMGGLVSLTLVFFTKALPFPLPTNTYVSHPSTLWEHDYVYLYITLHFESRLLLFIILREMLHI